MPITMFVGGMVTIHWVVKNNVLTIIVYHHHCYHL